MPTNVPRQKLNNPHINDSLATTVAPRNYSLAERRDVSRSPSFSAIARDSSQNSRAQSVSLLLGSRWQCLRLEPATFLTWTYGLIGRSASREILRLWHFVSFGLSEIVLRTDLSETVASSFGSGLWSPVCRRGGGQCRVRRNTSGASRLATGLARCLESDCRKTCWCRHWLACDPRCACWPRWVNRKSATSPISNVNLRTVRRGGDGPDWIARVGSGCGHRAGLRDTLNQKKSGLSSAYG